jgi:hypothetical protein
MTVSATSSAEWPVLPTFRAKVLNSEAKSLFSSDDFYGGQHIRCRPGSATMVVLVR